MPERLTDKSLAALCWGYMGFACRAVVNFGYTVVLARLLGPKPFGQVAVALLVVGFANLLADGGFELALVQSPALTERDIRFAFTIQLIVGSILTFLCAVLAPVVALVFRDPTVTGVLRWMSLVFLIQSAGQVSTALLKRRLDFRRLQAARVGSSLLGYAGVGILMAWLGCGVWSLVGAQLTQSAVYSAMVFLKIRHPLSPSINRGSFRLARYGIKVAGTNIVNWCISNLDNAFAGRSFGSEALGLYSRAFNTSSLPADAIVSTWQQVLVASCSRACDRPDVIRRAYLAAFSAVMIITVPLFCGVAVSAHTVVLVLYGNSWGGVIPLLPPLALGMVLHTAMALSGPVLSAMDRVSSELKAQFISLVIAVPAFLIAVRYSLAALAWTVFGIYCIRFYTNTRPLLKAVNLGWTHVLYASRGALVSAASVTVTVWLAGAATASRGFRPATSLLILAFAGMCSAAAPLLFAADRILSPELIAFLEQVSPSLPGAISHKVKLIANRQRISVCAVQ